MTDEVKCELCQGAFGRPEFRGWPVFKNIGLKTKGCGGEKPILCKYCAEYFKAEDVEDFP